MTNFLNQPRPDDAVLASPNLAPIDAVVLGSIESVKQRLQVSDVKVRIAALEDALNYGEAGYSLVIAALKDEIDDICWAAYELLERSQEQKVKQTLPYDSYLGSEQGVDYRTLWDLLRAEKWKEANRETSARMLAILGKNTWIDDLGDRLKSFPCKDLTTIDRLWVYGSKGRYGFSAQKEIWQQCGSPRSYRDDWKKFRDCLGWHTSVEHQDLHVADGSWGNHSPLGFFPRFCAGGWLPFSCLVWRLVDDDLSWANFQLIEGRTVVKPKQLLQGKTLQGDENLYSAKKVDYRKLRDLLIDEKWQEANWETSARMLEVMGKEYWSYVSRRDLKKFPRKDLKTIDRLWVQASQGYYGFSVQQKIWQECGKPMSYNNDPQQKFHDEDWEKLGDRLSWRKKGKWVSFSNLKWDGSKIKGHLPLPWYRWGLKGGGSCGAAFFSLGSLFSRVKACKL